MVIVAVMVHRQTQMSEGPECPRGASTFRYSWEIEVDDNIDRLNANSSGKRSSMFQVPCSPLRNS
jgi:hypothetical protein